MLALVATFLLTTTLAPLFSSITVAAATLPISSDDEAWRIQQIILEPAHPYRPTASSKHSHKYLDAAANTVGVLFMNSADEGVHVWLPIGERVFVSTSSPEFDQVHHHIVFHPKLTLTNRRLFGDLTSTALDGANNEYGRRHG
jgi:hypothetical protein